MASAAGVRGPVPFRGMRLAAALMVSAAALAAGDVPAGVAHPGGGHGHGAGQPAQTSPATPQTQSLAATGPSFGKGKPGAAGGGRRAGSGPSGAKAHKRAAATAAQATTSQSATQANATQGPVRASASSTGTSSTQAAGTTHGKGRGNRQAHMSAAPAPTVMSVPAATPVIPAASIPPAQATAPSAPAGARPHASRRHKASHRSSRHPGAARRPPLSGSTRAAAVSPALASGAGSSSSAATPPRSVRRHGVKGRSAKSGGLGGPVGALSGPLIKTITRIVDVFPAPLRVLIALLVGLALAFAVALRVIALRARRLDRQRRELLEDVGLLQAALLPDVPDWVAGVRASVAYLPADGPAAGGDFYDVFELADGQVGVIVGDLSGHGRRALPHTSLVRFTLRAHLEAGLSPKLALQSAAPVLERQLGESFATVVVACYDPRSRRLVYATAGHPPPVILAPDSLAALTTSSSPPIGVGWPTGLRQTTVDLPGSAVICFYTDGLVEARAAVGARFGTRRLERAVAELGTAATAAQVLDRVAAETIERPDDMAACVLEVVGDSAEATIAGEELELAALDGAPERIESFLAACGMGEGAIAAAKQAALPDLLRGRSVVLQVSTDGGAPSVTVSRGEVARLPRTSIPAAERRTMAQ